MFILPIKTNGMNVADVKYTIIRTCRHIPPSRGQSCGAAQGARGKSLPLRFQRVRGGGNTIREEIMSALLLLLLLLLLAVGDSPAPVAPRHLQVWPGKKLSRSNQSRAVRTSPFLFAISLCVDSLNLTIFYRNVFNV